MNHKQLGNIPFEHLQAIKDAVMPVVLERPLTYRVVSMGDEITSNFYKILFPGEFVSKYLTTKNTKLFITPMYQKNSFIHKDGLDKKCALNVVIDCNPTDWVRWYSDDEIKAHDGNVFVGEDDRWPGQTVKTPNVTWGVRRVTNLTYNGLTPLEELTNQRPGDFYLINTDIFHTFKNEGNNYRLIIQTKFDQNDSIEEVYAKLQETGLNF